MSYDFFSILFRTCVLYQYIASLTSFQSFSKLVVNLNDEIEIIQSMRKMIIVIGLQAHPGGVSKAGLPAHLPAVDPPRGRPLSGRLSGRGGGRLGLRPGPEPKRGTVLLHGQIMQ